MYSPTTSSDKKFKKLSFTAEGMFIPFKLALMPQILVGKCPCFQTHISTISKSYLHLFAAPYLHLFAVPFTHIYSFFSFFSGDDYHYYTVFLR